MRAVYLTNRKAGNTRLIVVYCELGWRFDLQDWARMEGCGLREQGEQAGNGLERLEQSVEKSIKVCAY